MSISFFRGVLSLAGVGVIAFGGCVLESMHGWEQDGVFRFRVGATLRVV